MPSIRTCLICATIAFLSTFVRAEDPATQETAVPPKLTWPEGWVEKKPLEAVVGQYAINESLDAAAELTCYPVGDFADGLSLHDWASHRIELLKESPVLKDAIFAEPREERAADHDLVIVEVDTVFKTRKFHYEHVYFMDGNYFCSFVIWSTPSHWHATSPFAEALIRTVR